MRAIFSLHRTSLTVKLLLLLAISSPGQVFASDFRITFLEPPAALNETCTMLQTAGVPQETIGIFYRLVLWQNEGGNGVDTTKFRASTNGAYLFHGLEDFTNRITHFFSESKGKPTFMCFDAACLLLYATGLRADSLESDFGSKNIIDVTPQRELLPLSKEVLASATNILTPPVGYRELVGKPRSDGERKLGLALHAGRRLAAGADNTDASLHSTFGRFLEDVRKDGFLFPTNFNLGMVFYVDTKRGFIKTDHAFLCFPRGRSYTILEKDNSPGPYVRADFESESDLAEYVSLGERRDTNNPNDVDFGSSVLVSLNDRLIGIFRATAHR